MRRGGRADVRRGRRRRLAGQPLVDGEDRPPERHRLGQQRAAALVVEPVLVRRVGVGLPGRDRVRAGVGSHAVERGLEPTAGREHRCLEQQSLVSTELGQAHAGSLHDVDGERAVAPCEGQAGQHADLGVALTEHQVEEHVLREAQAGVGPAVRLREAPAEPTGVAVGIEEVELDIHDEPVAVEHGRGRGGIDRRGRRGGGRRARGGHGERGAARGPALAGPLLRRARGERGQDRSRRRRRAQQIPPGHRASPDEVLHRPPRAPGRFLHHRCRRRRVVLVTGPGSEVERAHRQAVCSNLLSRWERRWPDRRGVPRRRACSRPACGSGRCRGWPA